MPTLGQMPKGPQSKETSLKQLEKHCDEETLQILADLAKKPGACDKVKKNKRMLNTFL